MPSSPAERAALVDAIRSRKRALDMERRRLDVVRQAYSYEVRIAMQDQHQTRGAGPANQQEARLVSQSRSPIGGFFIGLDG